MKLWTCSQNVRLIILLLDIVEYRLFCSSQGSADTGSATSISYKTGIFPLSDDVFGIYLMFFLHNFIWPCDLDLWTLAVSKELRTWYVQRTYQFLASFMCDSIWSHYHHLERLLRMRRVAWPITGGKMIHIFEIPDTNLLIHFVTFREVRQSLSHVICEKNCIQPIV